MGGMMTTNQPSLSDFRINLVPKFAIAQRVRLVHSLCVEAPNGYEFMYCDEIVTIVGVSTFGVVRYRIAIQGSERFHWVNETALAEVTG